MMKREAPNMEMFSVVRQLLEEGESVKVSVKGQSMLPFFRSGSTITLRPIREEDFRKGNVVLGYTGHSYVVHRIIRVTDSEVTLFGDGNLVGTETMTRDNVFGIVNCGHVHRFLARIWLWMRPVRRYPLWFIRRVTPK